MMGSQTANGTSQTWATGAPAAVEPMGRWTQLELIAAQSLSDAQSAKHQALAVEMGSGFKQMEPAAQLSLRMVEPATTSMSHASNGCLRSVTLTHAAAPVLSMVHFSPHAQPLWHAGSHAPATGALGVHRGSWQARSSGGGPSSVLPESTVITPPRQQRPSTQEKSSGQAFEGPQSSLPSTTLGL